MSRLMLCGVVSWLVLIPSAPLCADDAEDKAVAFVEKLGGWVTRDEKLPGKPVIGVHLSFKAVTDVGLKELAPLKNVTSLELFDTKVTDAGLKELAPLEKLTTLHLSQTQVTDAGLEGLAPLKNLKELDLRSTQVTDSGLKKLAPLKNLTTLNLSSTQVTDAGLKGLAPLENLTYLGLGGTPVTDAGLKELAPLKNLTNLGLSATQVTDVGLKELAPLKNLEELYLSGTKITDAGLKELAPLKHLTSLYLIATPVTDAGLNGLAPLKNLTTLNLSRTQVTDAGVKELQKALPRCEIQPFADPRGRKAHPLWTRVNAADGNFRALFPVEPKRSKTEDPLGFVYSAGIPDENVRFFITYTPNIVTSVSLDTRLTASQDLVKGRNAQRRSVDICGYAGRELTHEYTYTNHTVVSRQRIFYAGTDMYQLLVLAVDRKTFPEIDANHFFSGFELLNESKEKRAPP